MVSTSPQCGSGGCGSRSCRVTLVASKISVSLAGRRVLAEVSLALGPGTLTIVIGPNGAGKSTLLKALTGILPPAEGEVRLDGRRLAEWPRRGLAERRAVLAQSAAIAFPFTVFEVVALGRVSGAPGRAAALKRMVLDCLEAVDLAGYEGRFFQQLSGGEQQRVQIARVLCQIGGPEGASGRAGPLPWLFLDEPTQSLDIAHQLVVLDIARRHVRAGGGALAILHDLNLASLYADRLVMLRAGRVFAEGDRDDVLTEARVQALFGARVSVVPHGSPARPYVLPVEHGEGGAQATSVASTA